ncbi:hypothetical protein [Megasphaera sueciensis]|uniref:hypothetical protein n=1 Tax=Megasphaera sueciensis TaxID=349094 RepID=UPI003D02ED9A
MWRTPDANEGNRGPKSKELYEECKKTNRIAIHLIDQVKNIKKWPTPRAGDSLKRGNVSNDPRNGLPGAVKWPTPKAKQNGDCPSEQNRHTPYLDSAIKMYPTPTKSDVEKWSYNTDHQSGKCLEALARTNKLSASKGQLNPDWVEILMGLPIGWTDMDCNTPTPWEGYPAPLNGGMWGTHTASHAVRSDNFLYGDGNMNRVLSPEEAIKKDIKSNQYDYEPSRVTTVSKNRVKRLKALGNGCVPQQVYPIFRAIMEIEGKM